MKANISENLRHKWGSRVISSTAIVISIGVKLILSVRLMETTTLEIGLFKMSGIVQNLTHT